MFLNWLSGALVGVGCWDFIGYVLSMSVASRLFESTGVETVFYILQRGVQWKQGVVSYMALYTSFLYNTTPTHCTPLPLHPPLQSIHLNRPHWSPPTLLRSYQHRTRGRYTPFQIFDVNRVI